MTDTNTDTSTDTSTDSGAGATGACLLYTSDAADD